MEKVLLLKTNYQFNLSLYQIGHEKCPPHHSFGPVMRDFYLLHFIVNGEGTLEVDNKQMQIKKGDLFLVPKGSVCRYFANANNPYEYYWIGFSGINDTQILSSIGFIENEVFSIETGSKFEQLYDAFKMIDNINSETSTRDNLLATSVLYLVLSILVGDEAEYNLVNENEKAIDLLVRYIEMNYNSKITMKTLENVSNMHRSNVYRLFEKYFNMSPTKYIENVRMEKAFHLLKNTDYSIKKIAILCGFLDSVYFCKTFKKIHRKTPTEARNLK